MPIVAIVNITWLRRCLLRVCGRHHEICFTSLGYVNRECFSVIGQSLVYIRSFGLVVTFGANQLRCRTVGPEGLLLNKMAKGGTWSESTS